MADSPHLDTVHAALAAHAVVLARHGNDHADQAERMVESARADAATVQAGESAGQTDARS